MGSAQWKNWLVPTGNSRVYANIPAWSRYEPEKQLFPGLMIVFLALTAMAATKHAQRGEAAEYESGGVASALHRDIEPAWQNSDGSIARAKAPYVTIGDDRGYAILFPNNGDLAQLAVRRDQRRRGIGTKLLQSAAAIAGKPLRIMNVDERDLGIAAFLEHNGATKTVRQLEMIRPLR